MSTMLLIRRIAYNLAVKITGKCTFCDSPLPPHPVNEEFCSIDCAAGQQEVDAEERAMYEYEEDDEFMDDHDPFENDLRDE